MSNEKIRADSGALHRLRRDRHPQTTMEELTLQDPAAYVQDLFHLEKHLRIDQRQAGASLVFDVYTGSIHQRFTFTEL